MGFVRTYILEELWKLDKEYLKGLENCKAEYKAQVSNWLDTHEMTDSEGEYQSPPRLTINVQSVLHNCRIYKRKNVGHFEAWGEFIEMDLMKYKVTRTGNSS
jgi:hypothetical protein